MISEKLGEAFSRIRAWNEAKNTNLRSRGRGKGSEIPPRPRKWIIIKIRMTEEQAEALINMVLRSHEKPSLAHESPVNPNVPGSGFEREGRDERHSRR